MGLHVVANFGPTRGLILGLSGARFGTSSSGCLEPGLGLHVVANFGPARRLIVGLSCARFGASSWGRLGADVGLNLGTSLLLT